MPDRNGGFPRLSDGVPHGFRCPASPRHALLAESLGKPSLWGIISEIWYYNAASGRFCSFPAGIPNSSVAPLLRQQDLPAHLVEQRALLQGQRQALQMVDPVGEVDCVTNVDDRDDPDASPPPRLGALDRGGDYASWSGSRRVSGNSQIPKIIIAPRIGITSPPLSPYA